jgi:hypothetical protein
VSKNDVMAGVGGRVRRITIFSGLCRFGEVAERDGLFIDILEGVEFVGQVEAVVAERPAAATYFLLEYYCQQGMGTYITNP